MRLLLPLTLCLGCLALAVPASNTLIVGTTQEPPTIGDPWSTNNLTISGELDGYLRAGLIGLDDNGKPFADIASRVPNLQNGDYRIYKDAGGQVIRNSVTYHLRPEARWSDGQPITAEDFQFWLMVAQDERVPVPSRDPWKNARISVQDAHTFTITYQPPYLFADQTSPGLAPKHVMAAAWQEFNDKTQGNKDAEVVTREWGRFISQFTSAAHLPPVVSGPFKPVNWMAGNRLTFTRNNLYWRIPEGGVNKYLQGVTYRFIPNTSTLLVNVLSGQLDAVSASGLSFDQGVYLAQRERRKYQTFFVPGAIWEHIDVNNRGPRAKLFNLDDPRIRQALLYSIDRKTLIQSLFQGRQALSNSWVNPISVLHEKNLNTYPYDPMRAKQLFAAVGWTPGSDGILQKNGTKFILNFSTTAGNTVRERVQQILQAQWKQVGVGINIQNYPASVFGSNFLAEGEEGKWDLTMYAWLGNPIFEQGDLFRGDGIPTAANGYAGMNLPGWKNAEFDALHHKASQEFDLSQRIKLFSRMQTIWNNEVPALPLYYRVNVYTKVPGLVNYTFSAYTQYPSWNAYRLGWASRGAVEVYKQK